MAKMYRIDDGHVFEGTLEQFRDCFSSNATPEVIEQWCNEQRFKYQLYHTIDPVDPEENPHNFHITGYSNVTVMHPVGSYIGWSKGPTVFASPMVYLSEANDKVEELQDRCEELELALQNMNHQLLAKDDRIRELERLLQDPE